jgi:pSer/pThr/pTyr-binding forkhead associated (FHA) protein
MAIVKCFNPQCDFFERAVPEGDCCPYCGEPLNTETPSSQATSQYYTPPTPEPIPVSPVFSNNPSSHTVVEPINSSLKLVHSNSNETFSIDRYSAINKIYLGRQEGIPSDRPVIDISNIPFAERVSRLHAYITWDNNRNSFTIVDDNSTNGTILNGQPLTPQKPYPLHSGDRLEFGREHKVIFIVEIN